METIEGVTANEADRRIVNTIQRICKHDNLERMMNIMQLMKIEELKPYPRNSEFFDDMTGEKWQEFLKSIKTSGVIEPIVITQDKVIVSGHQRVRACKELGITEILAEVKTYDNEDGLIKDLLETNMRQRGEIGGSSVKLGRRIRELERIYGIQKGNNQHSNKEDSGLSTILTQKELADKLGISLDTLKSAKSLTLLPQEIQGLIERGNISTTAAIKIISKLTAEQQEQLIRSLPVTERLTQRQVQGYVDRIKKLEESDTFLNNEYQKRCKELSELREQLRGQKELTPQEQFSKKLKDDTIFFCGHVADFLRKNGGYVWITEHLNELPEHEKKSYIAAIDNIGAWYQNLRNNIVE